MGSKTIWTHEMIAFIKDNWQCMTNAEIAEVLGLNHAVVRAKTIELGFKRIEMEYWTKEQIAFLKTHYKTIGDIELSQIFNSKWKKNKPWTLKHIEKKRMYLKLRRSPAELKVIRQRNKLNGCWKNTTTWKTRGEAPLGTVKIWKGKEYIKRDDGYHSLGRSTWETTYGMIPPGMNIVKLNPQLPASDITNLEMITNEQLAARNTIARFPADVRKTIYLLSKLNKKLNEKQNQ